TATRLRKPAGRLRRIPGRCENGGENLKMSRPSTKGSSSVRKRGREFENEPGFNEGRQLFTEKATRISKRAGLQRRAPALYGNGAENLKTSRPSTKSSSSLRKRRRELRSGAGLWRERAVDTETAPRIKKWRWALARARRRYGNGGENLKSRR